jgi:hypothetical protein
MRLTRDVPGVDGLTPVHEKLSMLHASECITLLAGFCHKLN